VANLKNVSELVLINAVRNHRNLVTVCCDALRRFGLWSLLSAAAVCLFACSGGSSEQASTYREQTLNWQPCDASALGDDVGSLKNFGVTMAELGSRVTCASMRAPINYANPGDGELQVALMRIAAENPKERLGAILFNPGGPGADGLVLAPIYAAVWARADPNTEIGRLYKQMSERYDIIGFSPRGTGQSTPLRCTSSETLDPIANETADRSQANVAAMLGNAQKIADACAKNPLTPFINSDSTARDMDLVRHLLGDEKLNYYGISYGSWLGTWYAGLFPERVGRMLLTGVVDQTQGLEESFLTIPMGYQRIFDHLIVPYAARHTAIFSNDSSAGRLGTIFESLNLNLKGAVSEVLEDSLRNASGATRAVLTMVAGETIRKLLDQYPMLEQTDLLTKLSEITIASERDTEYALSPDGRQLTGKTLDAIAHEQGAEIIKGYFARRNPVKETVDIPGAVALSYAVVSNDMSMRLNTDDWIAITNQNSSLYPLTGGKFTSWPGLYWRAASVNRPTLESVNKAGNILLVHNEFDGVTPLEGPERSLPYLPNASFILIRNEYTHGTFLPYGNACSDEPVARYFLYGIKPPRRTECMGKPLYWDR
jgi:pimeloyl-ACP methyl ester carboxylesterase